MLILIQGDFIFSLLYPSASQALFPIQRLSMLILVASQKQTCFAKVMQFVGKQQQQKGHMVELGRAYVPGIHA